MKTNVVMESIDRELMGLIIKQRTKDEFFNLGDIKKLVIKYGIENNKDFYNFRLDNFLASDNVKEFIAELEEEKGCQVYYKGGKGRDGWVHPYLAIKILTHYIPKLEIRVYDWLFDYLIRNRKNSCDSYKNMCGVLWTHARNKSLFSKDLQKLANLIKEKVGCDDWNEATKEQLEKRDYLHNIIKDFVDALQDCKNGIAFAMVAYDKRYNNEALLTNETH